MLLATADGGGGGSVSGGGGLVPGEERAWKERIGVAFFSLSRAEKADLYLQNFESLDSIWSTSPD